MHDYFGHGFHRLSVIKHLKAKILSDGDPWTKSNQMGVCGLVSVSLGVLDVKKFEDHWFTGLEKCGVFCFLLTGICWQV